MKELRRHLIILFTSVMALTGIGAWWLLTALLPESYFIWYPLIPSFFFLMGLTLIWTITRAEKENPRKILNLYMLLKLYKVAACLVIGAFYYVFVGEKIAPFSAVFISYYLLYLGMETYFFYMTEKLIGKDKYIK